MPQFQTVPKDAILEQPPGPSATQLSLGSLADRLFIVDDATAPDLQNHIDQRCRLLPYSFTDADRGDTQHIKHLKHDFDLPDDPNGEPELFTLLLADFARDFLSAQSINAGPLYRIYANFNLFGDFQFAHEDGQGWTALYFANARWEEDWGGEFLAYPDGENSYACAIAPRPGRMIIFEGMIRHRGGVPSKLCHDPRMSIAFKFAPAT